MDLVFNEPNLNFCSNEIKRVKYNIIWVPFLTIFKYFFWNSENIYFLFLSLFQLSTLCFLPKEWSPTGPFSTAIPLLICILMEILTNSVKWYKDWRMDITENNKMYMCINKNGNIYIKENKYIYPGDIIYLKKDDICPIDGILIDTSNNEKVSKINLALLTGESYDIYVLKPNKYYKLNDYLDSKLIINEYHYNNFHNIEGKIINKNKEMRLEGENFVVSGSIIKSDDVYIWVTRCGKDKKSYLKNTLKSERKKSRIDLFLGKYMMNVNAKLLLLLIFLNTCVKIVNANEFSFSNIIFYTVQNWILFNGIIPFSVKIFLIMARTLQSNLLNKKYNYITINNSLQIDDICKINKILSDKTGTLTKNELEFSKILQVNDKDIIDVSSFNNIKKDLNIEFHKCLGLCIHQSEGEYNTSEDKTIRYRYQYLNNRISQSGNKITLYINNNKFDYNYIEIGGLDFTFERRISSKIVKNNQGIYFIYCKGSLNIIEQKIKKKYIDELKRLDNLISSNNPELRLLVCAYREVPENEINNIMIDCINKSSVISMLENELELLGIIGIKDNLQQDVKNTVNKLQKYDLECCLLTGDRKITAIAIAKEAGIISNKNIFDFTLESQNNEVVNIDKTTMIFSGNILEIMMKDDKSYENFCHYILNCKNFVGFNLIPEHKRKLANLLENKEIKTLTLGDGFNDVGMFDVSSVSVAIKGNSFVESNADFSIKEFKNLDKLFDITIDSYYKNSKLINFTFLRCSAVIFSIFTYCLLNYDKLTISLFNGFVLQAFNFSWTLPGIAFYILNFNDNNYNKTDYFRCKFLTLTSFTYTSFWNWAGIMIGILLTLINFYWFSDNEYLNDIICIVLITILNIKLILYSKFHFFGIILSFIGIINFLIYTIYMNSYSNIIFSLIIVNKFYWICILLSYFLVSLFLA